jgi:uncharacterized membrane protein required for colicin V production
MTQWEKIRLVLIVVLVVLFMKGYTSFKKCFGHTQNFSYCVGLPNGEDHTETNHQRMEHKHSHKH